MASSNLGGDPGVNFTVEQTQSQEMNYCMDPLLWGNLTWRNDTGWYQDQPYTNASFNRITVEVPILSSDFFFFFRDAVPFNEYIPDWCGKVSAPWYRLLLLTVW